MSACTLSALRTTGNLNSWLRSWGPRWGGSYLSVMAFLSKLHIFTLDVLRLKLVTVVVHNDSKFVKFIKAVIWVLFPFPFLVVAFGSLLARVFVHKLIWDIGVRIWVVIVIEHVFERILRLLLLAMVLLRVVWVNSAGQIVDGRVRIVTHTTVVYVRIVLPSRVSLRILRLLLLVLINILLILIKIRVICIHLIVVTLVCRSTDVRICRLLSSVVKSILRRVLLTMLLFFDKPLGSFLVELVVNLVNAIDVGDVISLFGWFPSVWDTSVLFWVRISLDEILLLCIAFFVVMTHVIGCFLFIANDLIVVDALEFLLTNILALVILVITVSLSLLLIQLSMLLILVFNRILDMLWLQLNQRLLVVHIGQIDVLRYLRVLKGP